MKLPTSIKFVAILAAVGAVIALIAFGVSLFRGTGSAATPSEGQNPFTALFPFLGGAPVTRPTATTTEGGDGFVTEAGPVPRLREVSKGPVAGARFVGKHTIRYVAQEDGNVYDTPADSAETVRISNTTVPGMTEVLWVGESRFIGRLLQSDGSFEHLLGYIATSAPEQSLDVASFTAFARGAVSADGSTLLTITETSSGSRLDVRDPVKGTPQRTVLSSAIRSWVPLVGGASLFVASAPTSEVLGYLYLIGTNGALTKVTEGLGLTALPSPTGRYILSAAHTGGVAELAVIDRTSGKTYESPLVTLTNKCAWTTGTELVCAVPNDIGLNVESWLLGAQGSIDTVWLIDVVNGTADIIVDPTKEAGAAIDAEHVAVSADGAYALFVNKNDLSLWSVRLR